METAERNKFITGVFTYLMRAAISKDFSFPGGGLALRTVNNCLDELQQRYSLELSPERMTDFVICQVYAISRFEKTYLPKWKVNHSFGRKAIDRYAQSTQGRKYYEDKWLSTQKLSRTLLCDMFKDRRKHPLYKFIYPEYEENTKRRMHNSEVGFYICQISTLLWTPFSELCQTCKNSQRCIDVLQRKYSELYRIRQEAYNKQERQ